MKLKPQSDKKIAFFVMIDGEDNFYSGNVKESLDFIESYLEEIEDKHGLTIDVTRKDMTEEEIEALPEI